MRPLSDSQREALEEATQSYHEALMASRRHADWLLARGIEKTEAVSARLGVVTDPFPGHSQFRDWLVIPYLDREGKPLTMRFRCIEEHNHREYGHGKYMSLAEDIPRVYNIGAIHRAGDTIEVAEGEFDAMILEKIGLHAVAIPGVHIWRSHMRRMLAGFSVIRVWADPDDAGAELVNRITRSLRAAKGVRLRDGDVSDTYKRGGAEALLALIQEGEG